MRDIPLVNPKRAGIILVGTLLLLASIIVAPFAVLLLAGVSGLFYMVQRWVARSSKSYPNTSLKDYILRKRAEHAKMHPVFGGVLLKGEDGKTYRAYEVSEDLSGSDHWGVDDRGSYGETEIWHSGYK
jgi:hypothetical protein